MNVCLVSSKYWPAVGGVEIYNRQVAHALNRYGHNVRIATRYTDETPGQGIRHLLTRSSTPQRYSDEGVTVHILGSSQGRALLLRPTYRLHHHSFTEDWAIRLTHLALRPSLRHALQNADVVHYSGTGRELLGFAALREARQLNAQFVVTAHLHPEAWGDSSLDFKLYRQADHYIALTEQEKKYVHDHGITDRDISIIGHGVNVDGSGNGQRVRQELNIDGPIVLYLGRKASYKGYSLVLEAAPTVWGQHPEVHFILAGPDDSNQTEAIRKAHRSVLDDPRMHERGFVSNEEREDLYDACTIYCQPSRAEAYGLVYLEAWAYGKPVIARQIPTMQELIEAQNGGLLVDGSGKSVAYALLKLLSNPELRREMGRAGYVKATSQTWDRVAKRLTQVYTSTIQ